MIIANYKKKKIDFGINGLRNGEWSLLNVLLFVQTISIHCIIDLFWS